MAAAGLVLGTQALSTILVRGAALTPLDLIELKTYDWRLSRTARPETARKDIALVEIDEYSLRNLQPNAGRWPWPRVVHSMLIDYLTRGQPKLIVYDVDFAEADSRKGFEMGGDTWSGAQSDRAFIDSVKQAANVILLADATFRGTMSDPPALPDYGYRLDGAGVTERAVIFPPFGALESAGVALGHNLFVFDRDGPMRHVVPFVRSHGRTLASLGVTAALRAAGIRPDEVRLEGDSLRFSDRVMPLLWRKDAVEGGTESYLWGLVNFRGPALLADLKSRTYPDYSCFDLLYSEEQIQANVKPKVDPAVFKDKIVFVGISATGLADTFETPFAHGKMAGIQIHAAVTDDILSNRFLTPGSNAVRIGFVLFAGLTIGLLATLVPAWWATAVTVATVTFVGWVAMLLFARGYWLNVTQPGITASLALFGGVGYQYFVEGREKRKMKRLFGRYVSKDVYAQLVANPSLASLGGKRRQMTVLFSDIRGFTTVSEKGQPEEIVHLLNEYFTRMVEIVFKHKGTVDKFVGDMVMALFGAPLDVEDHARCAVEAALDMLEELHRLNEKWAAEGRGPIDIGIGVNTGPMIAGNIGSEQIMSYTVIGDSVNLGSRLESLNKQYATHIIISDATREAMGPGYELRPLGDVVVKGKTKPVAIFELLGRAGSVAASAPAEAVH